MSDARNRLLGTASRLFYGEGLHSVGVDRILQVTEGTGSEAAALVVKTYTPAIPPVPSLPGGAAK